MAAGAASDTLRFDGRVAIVTGAGGGLGRSYAILLAERGAKVRIMFGASAPSKGQPGMRCVELVLVNDLGGSLGGKGGSTRPAQAVVDEITAAGGTAAANFDSVEDGAKIVQAAVDLWGKVDILINNAGILRDVSFHKMSDADWEAVYRVHLRGTFAVTRAAWPLMREQGYGRVVMASSAAGLYGNFGQANYAAMKMAMVGLANTLAIEGARRNIAVNVVCPVASSRMTETVLPDELLSSLRADLVAPIVAYLCHESCADNGAVVECGGGWAGKLRRQRAKGVFFPAAQNPGAKGFEMEDVARAWKTICSYEDADYPETNQDVFGVIMEHVEAARASKL